MVLKNTNREVYCQNRIKGMTQRQAYLDAYPRSRNWKPSSVDDRAYKLEKTAEVMQRLNELREMVREAMEEQEKNAIMTAAEIQQQLSSIGRGEAVETLVTASGKTVEAPAKTSDRITAMDKLAKMSGLYDNSIKVEMAIPIFEGADALED